MVLEFGTNCGFVEEAPTGDPEGSTDQLQFKTRGQKDTSPSGATTITEIGWYTGTATEEANFEVGVYDDDSDSANNLLSGANLTNAKGTDAGWKTVTGLNIAISEETPYWISVQLDDTETATNLDKTVIANPVPRSSVENDVSTLSNPFGGSEQSYYAYAIYAVWEAGGPPPATSINIGDSWKTVSGANVLQVNIGDTWKAVAGAQVNIADTWKPIVLL